MDNLVMSYFDEISVLTTKGKSPFSAVMNVSKTTSGSSDRPVHVMPEEYKTLLSELSISPWGPNNLLPNEIKEDIRKTSVLKRALKFRIDAHYGKGVDTFKKSIEGDKLSFQPFYDPRIDQFLRNSWISHFQHGLISDWEFFRNIFAVIITNQDRTRITSIYRQHAMHCRYSRMNEKNMITDVHVADWSNGKINNENVVSIPVLDQYDPLGDLASRKSGHKFVLPIRASEFDNLYYDETFWEPVRASWLPIACAVPKIRAAIMENQMLIKYHIRIPQAWLKKKEKDLQLDTEEKKKDFLTEFLKRMDDYLTDTENAGKGFISFYGVDPINPGNTMEEWKIDVVDNKLKHEDHLPDSIAANSEILTGIGVDPALIGGQLPGGGEAGSGSNKREAYWIHQSQIHGDRMYTTRWFDLVAQHNGWPSDVSLRYINVDTSQTLDKNPTGTKTVL